MEIKAWGPENTLPSVDCCCLQAMSYSRMCGAPVKFIQCNNPWASPSGSFPVFNHGPKVSLTKFEDIKNHLSRQNFDTDVELTVNEKADIIAYKALLKDKLAPALLYVLWWEERNYTGFTRPWFAKRLPFPLNYYIPGKMQRAAVEEIKSVYEYEDATDEQRETLVYKGAQECIVLLSQRLGNRDFFFGKSPCSIDAIVFGYLAPLLKIGLPNAQLSNHLKACENLVQFVARILQRYFPNVATNNTDAKKAPGSNSSNNPSPKNNEEKDEDFPHKWRDIFLWSTFSFSAMLIYALSTGFITIKRIEADEDNDFDVDLKENKRLDAELNDDDQGSDEDR